MNVRITLITAILLLSIGEIFAQSKSVMIKSVETWGNQTRMKNELYVIDAEGNLIKTEIEKYNKDGIPINMVTIKDVIDKYLSEGYAIQTSNAIAFGAGFFTVDHTYILIKED